MQWWIDLMQTPIMRKVISSFLLLVFLFGIRIFLVRRLSANKQLSIKVRGQSIATVRNLIMLVFLASLFIIWIEQLRLIAATTVVVAAAIVIATKELILNITGFFFRITSQFIAIGDRIEVGDFRGDVIDQNMMGVTLLEIGPGGKTHQHTGRAVFLPNSNFLGSPVVNETYVEDYVFHVITIPLKRDADWKRAESLILEVAGSVSSPYLLDAENFMRKLAQKHGLDAPSVKPRVHVQIPEPDEIHLILRVPVPARKRARMEEAIIRNFLILMEKASQKEKPPENTGEQKSEDLDGGGR